MRLLEHPFAKPGEYENTVDTANGYMRLNLSDNWGQYVVLTSFARADGTRLVVLQTVNENHVERDAHTEDYFYTLAPGGRYTEVEPASVLPPITFEDFWGEQAPPPAGVRRLFDEEHLYNIEWPRSGTTALVRSYPPYNTGGKLGAAEGRAKETYGRRRFATMELVWDAARGAFTKGRKVVKAGPDSAWEKGPSLTSLCAAEEATFFNCAVAEGGKILSICGSKEALNYRGRGYVQYRFGRPGRVELEFPRGRRRRPADDFTLDFKQARGRSHFAELRFDSGNYRYTVHEIVNAGERAQDVEKDAWVEVRTHANMKEAVGVARSFRCLDPVQGSLGILKGIAREAPAR